MQAPTPPTETDFASSSATTKSSSTACILGLGTAVPPFMVTSEEYSQFVIDSLKLGGRLVETLQKLTDRSGIAKRYFCVNDALTKNPDEWRVLTKDFPQVSPSMTVRNKVYCEEAPKLATEAAKRAVNNWGGQPKDITHIISISCTGVMAPGIEFYVMEALGIPRTCQRLGINIMGCFGAFRGIATARAFARENPSNRVLVVCTELCSLHFQAELSFETFIGNAIFADGAGAFVLGTSPKENEKTLWEVEDTASLILEHTPELMTWEASDHGFLMKLSQKIPESLTTQTPTFAQRLLGDRCKFSECGWAIHPGGKAIVAGLEEALGLEKWQTQCSWEVLKNYGNISSATFLFVLDYLRENKPIELQTPWIVGLGFGPGLALEGVLLKYGQDN
jgi:predicted naringenin-chalcone synthase